MTARRPSLPRGYREKKANKSRQPRVSCPISPGCVWLPPSSCVFRRSFPLRCLLSPVIRGGGGRVSSRGPSLLPGAERHPAPSPPFSPLLIIFSFPVREYIVTTARPGNGEEIGTPALPHRRHDRACRQQVETLHPARADPLRPHPLRRPAPRLPRHQQESPCREPPHPGGRRPPHPHRPPRQARARRIRPFRPWPRPPPLFDAMAAWGEAYRRAAE